MYRTRTFLAYAGAGAVGTAVHYAAFLILLAAAAANAAPAAAVGAALGAGTNYLFSRRAFASRRPHRQALSRFLIVASVCVALQALIVGTLVATGVQALAAQGTASLCVLLSGFLANRRWTFAWQPR